MDVLLLLLGLLESLQAQFGLVLARYVPSHRVVAGEGAGAEGTGHADALVTLADVRAQIRLVAVQSFAKRALQFLSCKKSN